MTRSVVRMNWLLIFRMRCYPVCCLLSKPAVAAKPNDLRFLLLASAPAVSRVWRSSGRRGRLERPKNGPKLRKERLLKRHAVRQNVQREIVLPVRHVDAMILRLGNGVRKWLLSARDAVVKTAQCAVGFGMRRRIV